MRNSAPLKDILWLLVFIILLPLALLLAGPMLVLAAMFGRLSLFNLQLNPGRRAKRGRVWAFVLGLLLWAVVWLGLAWLITGGQFPPLVASQPEPAPVVVQLTATATPSPQPAAPTSTPTGTPSPAETAPADAAPTATATIVVATDTPAPRPPTTATATPVPTSPPPTATPTATRVLPAPNLSSDEQTEVLQGLIHANNLLVAVMEKPDGENTSALSLRWRETALTKVETFAQDVNQKYDAPLIIHYSNIGTPQTKVDAQTGRVQVISREFWTFETPSVTREALVDYQYTLQNINDRWLVVQYDFGVVPLPGNPNAINTTEGLVN